MRTNYILKNISRREYLEYLQFTNNFDLITFFTEKNIANLCRGEKNLFDDKRRSYSHQGHLFTLQKSHRSIASFRPGWSPVNRGWLWIEWRLVSWRRLTTSRSSTEARPALFAIRLSPLMIIVIIIPRRSIRRTKGNSSRRRREIGESIHITLYTGERIGSYKIIINLMFPEIKIAKNISGKLYSLLFLSFYDLKTKKILFKSEKRKHICYQRYKFRSLI